jgi:hypothetical protein
LTPTRAATFISGVSARGWVQVLCITTPWASISSAAAGVPASTCCSCCSSEAPACSSWRLRRSTLCTRLAVTGSNSTGRSGCMCCCTQRIHDWMTTSLISPVGRSPRSKNRSRASASRCVGELKKGLAGSMAPAVS